MEDYEKLGVFYFGREYDLKAKKSGEHLILYDSRDMVTHGVCVGMTGSGKTAPAITPSPEAPKCELHGEGVILLPANKPWQPVERRRKPGSKSGRPLRPGP